MQEVGRRERHAGKKRNREEVRKRGVGGVEETNEEGD